jgi:hypothetical protein
MPGERWVIALLLAAAVVGCGSAAQKARPGLTSGQASALVKRLEAVRTTAAGGDVAATEAALGRFRAEVTRLRQVGALSDATARRLRIGAARVLARMKSDSAPAPAPTTQTTPAPAPPPPQPKQQKHADKKPPHGVGKGHDKKHGGGGD